MQQHECQSPFSQTDAVMRLVESAPCGTSLCYRPLWTDWFFGVN